MKLSEILTMRQETDMESVYDFSCPALKYAENTNNLLSSALQKTAQ